MVKVCLAPDWTHGGVEQWSDSGFNQWGFMDEGLSMCRLCDTEAVASVEAYAGQSSLLHYDHC